jgi:hypothetical protein
LSHLIVQIGSNPAPLAFLGDGQLGGQRLQSVLVLLNSLLLFYAVGDVSRNSGHTDQLTLDTKEANSDIRGEEIAALFSQQYFALNKILSLG